VRISKSLIGKVVEVRWIDPREQHHDTDRPPFAGKEALAKWIEWGVVHDITDGVLRLMYSTTWVPEDHKPDGFHFTWIPASLIVDIRVLGDASEVF